MDKNISNFINDHYISFGFSDLIFRILGLLFYNLIVIYTLAILSPIIPLFNDFSYDDLFSISRDKLPLILLTLILTVILSIVISVLYAQKTKWSVILIRGLTYFYISISLLASSCICNIKIISDSLQNITIIIKVLLYIVCTIIYAFYLNKKKLPNYLGNKNKINYFVYLFAIVIGIFTSRILAKYSIEMIDICSFISYVIAVCLIVNTVDLFTKAYYAKRYSL